MIRGKSIKPIFTKNISIEVDGDEELLSPVARLFQAKGLNIPIIYVLGFKTLIDVDAVKSGLNDSFVKHPRFSSLLVTDEKNGGQMSWRRTKVDIHKHVFTPEVDPNMESAEMYVEDYISNLTNTGLDLAKPLWELHVLNVKTSDANATAVLKVHHSVGDGTSFISLLLASSRKASDLESMPSVLKTRQLSTNFWNNRNRFWGLFSATCSMILMVFNTFVDILQFVITALFLKDTDTPIKGVSEHIELSRKRIVHRIVSLHDIKLVKYAMNATINDVLLGITMAALSRYLNGKYAPIGDGLEKEQDTASKKYNHLPANIRLRSSLAVNIRSSPGTSSAEEMMEKDQSKVKWGNLFTFVLVPITIALLDDPLDYVRKAKAVVDRKKLSFEAIFYYSLNRFLLKFFGLKITAAHVYKILSNTTMAFSNIIGPQEEISFYGHHLSYIAPSTYGHPHAFAVHWQSYGEKMIFVLTVDPDVIPDYNNLCADFESSLKLIKDAVTQSGLAVPFHAKT
ncbi:wax ester synthase/diacylglycerol acyltransferase 11-like isoform X1 [Apium graveolens]|uniref:wax ester synthase/diacylglycerol acyltransferase 11-like isoform X1 n=1 Tax=Apium graveolens TaxID=4045 RepID=UPI003D78B3DD